MKISWLGWLFVLLVFLSLYGGAHTLIFFRVKAALSLEGKTLWWLGAFLGLMLLTPIAERFLDHAGLETLARGVAYAGYVWMSVLFLTLMAYLLFSGYRGIIFLAGKILTADLGFLRLSDAAAILTALGLAAGITVYGHFEAWSIRTTRIFLQSEKIPANLGKIRIAQISDVHLGLINRDAKLAKIAAILRQEQPDLLVSTGDLVDGEVLDLDHLADYLRVLQPRFGKYAIIGNHEVFAGVIPSVKFTQEAGFVVLRNEGIALPGLFNVAGVDDPAIVRVSHQALPPERDILSRLPPKQFTLLLKHQPRVETGAQGLFDLQLSGHTHAGQIFPFGIFTRLAYPLDKGLTKLGPSSWIYVSRGTGTWGPPIRFLAPPEVTIFEISAPAEKRP
jgi:predicted MPP superfamily phosphohydrolase